MRVKPRIYEPGEVTRGKTTGAEVAEHRQSSGWVVYVSTGISTLIEKGQPQRRTS